MIPASFKRLLFGGGQVRKRRTPPIAVHYPEALVEAAKADPRVRHDLTQGEFRVVDDSPGQRAGVILAPVDATEAAAAMAAELQRLSASPGAVGSAPAADQSRRDVPDPPAARRADAPR